jgi:3-oxoadipate enol-lactonase
MPILHRKKEPDLHYEVDDYTDPWKNAPCILLQHGYGRSSRFWYRWVPYLARFYKVVRPDLRGLGRSAKDFDLAKGLNPAAYFGDLNAILDELGVTSVHYCGESLGGILGMMFAGECPKRIRTLSLVSAPVFLNQDFQDRSKFGHASWEEALRKMGSKGYALAKNQGDRFSADTDPGLMDWFAEQQGASDVEVLIAMQKIAAKINATEYLSRIEAPVLAIFPSEGPITTPEQEALLRENVKDFRMVHLPSRHHNLHLTQPAACANHVLHFAAQHDGVVCHE